MYKRIASVSDEDEIRDLQEEMIDRFGLLPEPTKNLFNITRLKLKAGPLGVRKIELGEKGGRMYFHERTNIDTGQLINLIQSQPQKYKLDGQNKLKISQEIPDGAMRFKVIGDLLESITLREAA